MSVHGDLARLCRLCMTQPSSGEMTNIFQDQENSRFPVKIISCFALEVQHGDQLPKEMCASCVYLLEKFYIFRKQVRKMDTKYRSFLRKVKSKKIQSLDEMSDDEEYDDENDTNVEFVEDFERKQVETKVKEQLATNCQFLVQQIKRELIQTVENIDESNLVFTDGLLPVVDVHKPEKSPPQKKMRQIKTLNVRGELENVEVEEDQEIFYAFGEHEDEENEHVERQETEQVEEEEEEEKSPSRKKPRREKVKLDTLKVEEEAEESASYASEFDETPTIVQLTNVNLGQAEAVILKTTSMYACTECGRKFPTSGALAKHQKNHSALKNVCSDCGKCFSSSSSLARHEKIHREVKDFKCETCGKEFTQNGSLQRHQLTHMDQSERPFSCMDCDKSFTQRHLLNQHATKAHSGQPVAVIYPCNECPKTFRHSSGLSRHALSHMGKQFTCSVCNLSLSDYSALKRHQKARHPECHD